MTHTQLTTRQAVLPGGLRLQVTEGGLGPLVILCHGFPELGHIWRHQLQALADAGFRAVAPDMRGYGGSDRPEDVQDYSLLHVVGDMVGLVAACGATQAAIVGHDWGATVAWTAALLRPDLFGRVAGLSVPFRPRGPTRPSRALRAAGLQTYYWTYFQSPGVAEAELERDVADSLRRVVTLTDADEALLHVPEGAGVLDGVAADAPSPAWLDPADLAASAAAFGRTGFTGGLNYYRNIDRNWELLAPWQGAAIQQPALFIGGTRDATLTGPVNHRALAGMEESLPRLWRRVMLDGAGHWLPQERPEAVSRLLIDFLSASTEQDARAGAPGSPVTA